MKKIFDDEYSVDDIKNSLKKLQQKKHCSNNAVAIIAAVGIVVLVAAAVVAIIKLTQGETDDDCFDEAFGEEDEDGMYFAEEEDFE